MTDKNSERDGRSILRRGLDGLKGKLDRNKVAVTESSPDSLATQLAKAAGTAAAVVVGPKVKGRLWEVPRDRGGNPYAEDWGNRVRRDTVLRWAHQGKAMREARAGRTPTRKRKHPRPNSRAKRRARWDRVWWEVAAVIDTGSFPSTALHMQAAREIMATRREYGNARITRAFTDDAAR